MGTEVERKEGLCQCTPAPCEWGWAHACGVWYVHRSATRGSLGTACCTRDRPDSVLPVVVAVLPPQL